MSFYKKSVGSTQCLPSFRATVHTTSVKQRYVNLKGLGAYVITTGESGDLAFHVPEELSAQLRHAGTGVEHEAAEKAMTDHFAKLFEKYELSWLRALHNPNIAFMDGGDIKHPYRQPTRILVANYFIATLNKAGYSLQRGIAK